MPTTPVEDARRRSITDQELDLACRTNGAARREALNRVIVANLEVAIAVARRYSGRGVDHDELVQLACLGLTTAAARFDPAKDHDFLSFAVPWMTGTIRHHFRDNTWAVRPIRRVQELHQQLIRLESDGTGVLSAADAADTLGVTRDAVVEALAARGLQKTEPILGSTAHGSGRPTADRIAAEESAEMRSADARLMVHSALRVLEPRERHVLCRLYVDEWTQAEVAREIGLSQVSVSRIHNRALDALRNNLGIVA